MEPEPVAPGSPSRDIRPVAADFRSPRRRQVRDAAESTMSPQAVVPHQPTRDGQKEDSQSTLSRGTLHPPTWRTNSRSRETGS